MATNFAKQRTCRGMAGFKFRTRTKSKYDRPPPEVSLLVSQQQLVEQANSAEKGKSRTSKSVSKARGGTVHDPITTEDVKKFFRQLLANDNRATHKSPLNEVIDFQEDVLRVRLATQNVADALDRISQNRLQCLVEDMLDGKEIDMTSPTSPNRSIYAQSRNAVAAMAGLLSGTGNTTSNPSVQENKHEQLAAVERLQQSMYKNLNVSSAAAFSGSVAGSVEQKVNLSRQKLRLSAEGLLDIVTQQVVEGNLTPQMMQKNMSEKQPIVSEDVINSQEIEIKQTSSSIQQQIPDKEGSENGLQTDLINENSPNKEAKLSPILTEDSQGCISSKKNNQQDNRQLAASDDPSAKLNSIEEPQIIQVVQSENNNQDKSSQEIVASSGSEVVMHQLVAANNEQKSHGEATSSQRHDFQKMLNPTNVLSSQPISRHDRSSQNLSRQQTNKSQKSPFLRRKATMSADNLRSTMTDRALEPRCDNEDLKLISRVDESGLDEFAKTLSGQQQAQHLAGKMGDNLQVDNQVDSQVGLIELKLTHRGDIDGGHNYPQSRFKKRLRSAGANKRVTRQGTGGWSSFSVNKPYIMATCDQNNANSNLNAADRFNAAETQANRQTIPHQQHSTNMLLYKPPSAGPQQFKGIPRNESWINNRTAGYSRHATGTIVNNQNANDGHMASKDIGSVLLSDKSVRTIELNKTAGNGGKSLDEIAIVGQQVLSPPSVSQLPLQVNKNSDDNQDQDEQAAKDQQASKSRQEARQTKTDSQLAQHKAYLQKMLEDEIERLKQRNSGARGNTPEIAFVDPGQLMERGVFLEQQTNPEKSLKFLEETMKEHFKYSVGDGAMSIGRPILSTRQTYSSQLQQKVLEQKILETLKDKNETEKYEKFESAQKLAAVMMDIVSSTQSGDIILEPKDMTMTQGTLNKDQLVTTLKLTDQEDLLSKTLTIQNDATIEQIVSPQISASKRTTSKKNKSNFKKKRVTIEVRNEGRQKDDLYSPINHADTARVNSRGKLTPEKKYTVPSQLNLCQQENVSQNIAQLNLKLVEQRKQMIQKRDSRQDTLNQLTSPKNQFSEIVTNIPTASLNIIGVGSKHSIPIANADLILSSASSENQRSPSPVRQPAGTAQRASNLNRAKSSEIHPSRVVSANNRKITMNTQGGGFNRSMATSGYFKGQKKQQQVDQPDLNQTQPLTVSKTEKNVVFVEERPQIMANEVWQSQGRGMPLKVVLQVQRAPPLAQELTSARSLVDSQQRDRSLNHPSMMMIGSQRDKLESGLYQQRGGDFIKRESNKIEVFPFQRQQTHTTTKPQTQMEILNNSKRVADDCPSPDSNANRLMMLLPTEGSQQRITERNQHASQRSPTNSQSSPTKLRGLIPATKEPQTALRFTSETANSVVLDKTTPLPVVDYDNKKPQVQKQATNMVVSKPLVNELEAGGGSLAAVNEQFSEGQQTASNNVIVDHRYSKQSKILESTVQLRASSTGLCGLLNTDSQVIDRFPHVNESHNNGDDRRRRDNHSSQELTGNKKERILNSLELNKQHKMSEEIAETKNGGQVNDQSDGTNHAQRYNQSSDQQVDKSDIILRSGPCEQEEDGVVVRNSHDNVTTALAKPAHIKQKSAGMEARPTMAEKPTQQLILTDSDSRPQASRIQNNTTSKISGDSPDENMIISRVHQGPQISSMPSGIHSELGAAEQESYSGIQEATQNHEETPHTHKTTQPMNTDESRARRISVLQKPTSQQKEKGLNANGGNSVQTTIHDAFGVQASSSQDDGFTASSQPHIERGESFRAQLTPNDVTAEQVLIQDSREYVFLDKNISSTAVNQEIKVNENERNLTTHPAVTTSPDAVQENKTVTAISPIDTDQGNQVPEMYDDEEPKSASVSSRPPLGDKAVRPQTTVPIYTNNQQQQQNRGRMNLCASQPRQVIYRNGRLISTNSSFESTSRNNLLKARNSRQRVPQNKLANADLQQFVSSRGNQKNIGLNNSGQMLSAGKQASQMTLTTNQIKNQINSAKNSENKAASKSRGRDFVRMTFTQGVSELIKNFDKKFIVNSVQMPQPFQVQAAVISQQKSIEERPPVVKVIATKEIASQASTQYINEEKDVNPKSNMSFTEAKATTVLMKKHMAPSQMETLLRDEISVQTPTAEYDRILPIQRPKELVRSHSRPAYTAGHKAILQQVSVVPEKPQPHESQRLSVQQKSPIQTTNFDTSGLTAGFQTTTAMTPNNVAAIMQKPPYAMPSQTTGASPHSTKSGALKPPPQRRHITVSSHRGVAQQHHMTQVGSSNSHPLSDAQSVQMQQQLLMQNQQQQMQQYILSSKQAHPLEFLAQTAIQSSKNDITNRHQDGLLMLDSKKVNQVDTEAAASSVISDQQQAQQNNIIQSLNSSRITSAQTKLKTQQADYFSRTANQKQMNMTGPVSANPQRHQRTTRDQSNDIGQQQPQSRESLLQLRKNQRQNRQSIQFGSHTIRSAVMSHSNNKLVPQQRIIQRPSLPMLQEAADSFYQQKRLLSIGDPAKDLQTRQHLQIMQQNSSDVGRSTNWNEDLENAFQNAKVTRQHGIGTTRAASFDSTNMVETIPKNPEANSLASSTHSLQQEKELEQSKSMAVMTSVFRKPPLRGLQKLQAQQDKRTNDFRMQPVRSVEKYNNLHQTQTNINQNTRNPTYDSKRINLTYGEIDMLFKDISRTQKSLNKSSILVKGIQMTSDQASLANQQNHSGGFEVGRRRVQSGNNQKTKQKALQQKFVAGQTMSKRSSMLFNQTTVGTGGGAAI